MSRDGSRIRRRLALVASSLFAVAFAAMLAAQLSLMSVLDMGRARTVADEVARSAFVTGLVDDAVRNAVAPVAGDDLARQVAATASTDPRVRGIVRSALVSSHRQLVDPDAPVGVASPQVDAVVGGVVDDIGEQLGVDLTGVVDRVQIPDARADRVPAVGLRDLALVTRAIAALVAAIAAIACVLVHPRPALGLAAIGGRVAIVCGIWVVTLLVLGWVIGRVADTLLGELLDAIWAAAAPTVLGVVGGGVLLGVGVWLGGRAVEGILRERRPVPHGGRSAL